MRRGVYALQEFGEFESPAVEFQIVSGSKVISMQNAGPPAVELLFTPNGPLPEVPVNGARWSAGNWAPMATRAVNEAAEVSVEHFGGSYTLIMDFADGVTLHEPDNLWVLHTFVGTVLGVFGVCLLAAIACDLQGHFKKRDHSPHRRDIVRYKALTGSALFNFVFRYSLFYNVHWLSIFAYRDRAIWMTAKVFWFFGLLGVIWSGAVILFTTDTLIGSADGQGEVASILVYGAAFGLLFVPNSFFTQMLTERPRDSTVFTMAKEKPPMKKPLKEDDSGELQTARDVIAVPVLPYLVHKKLSKRGLAFFVVLTALFWATPIAVTVIMGRQLMKATLHRFARAAITVAAAYAFGFVYTLFKAILATSTAVQFRKIEGPNPVHPQSMGVQLFVDERTAFVHEEVAAFMESLPPLPQPEPVNMEFPSPHSMHAAAPRKKQSGSGGVGIFENIPKVTDDSPAEDFSELPSYRNPGGARAVVYPPPPRSSNTSRRAFR